MTQRQSHPPPTLQQHPSLPDVLAADAAAEPLSEDLPMRLGSDGTETEEDDRMDGVTTPPRVYQPPPHIAARFYRSSASTAAQAARRKSSAASSRRNSISSTHSRSSHGYGVDSSAPQSKHVAQHLRRASILADRKARLADRAAHAEQVRLRAALAKAATRDISLSEERAQAAAQAREKNLAEIAATCAEEVKRAKAIAETIKEKRLQNLLRLRQQIQDRLDDAERRREELRRSSAAGRSTRTRGQSIANSGDQQVEVMPQVAEVAEHKEAMTTAQQPMAPPSALASLSSLDGEGAGASGVAAAAAVANTASLLGGGRDERGAQRLAIDLAHGPALSSSSPPPPALTPDEAACKIVHWWRKAHRRRTLSEFRQLGLSVDSVQERSFKDVVDLLARESVLTTTARVLRLCGIREGKTSSVKEVAVVRAFLSAFLILGHPTHVLSDNGGAIPTPPPGSVGHAAPTATPAADSHCHHQQEQVGLPGTTNPPPVATPAPVAAAGHTNTDLADLDVANPQLQELVSKAKDLLICFETIISRLSPANNYTPSASLAGELVEAYDRFYDAFIAWKARDASTLVEVMVLQFVELDAIWQTVKDSTETAVSATYRESIQQNQLLLMVRIKKLAGAEAGKKKVFEAVRKARRAKAEAKKKAAAATTNMKPREADETTIETAMGDLTGGDTRPGNTALTSHAAATMSASSLSGQDAGSGTTPSAASAASTASAAAAAAAAGAMPEAAIATLLPEAKPFSEARAEAKLHNLRSRAAAISRSGLGMGGVNGAETYSTSPLPENRILVHELALNNNYHISSTDFPQLQAAWMAPIFARMRKTMPSGDGSSDSAGDDNRQREEQNEHFYYLLTIADVIRSKLERLTMPGKRMHQLIGELLDTELAQRQFAVGSFSYERFFSSVGQLLPKLCAPVRDEEVKLLVEVGLQQGSYVDRLQALLYFVDVMLTDHINFMISVAAPRLLPSAAAYETRRFTELVAEWSSALDDEEDGGSVNKADGGNNDDDDDDDDDDGQRLLRVLPAAASSWWSARNKVVAEAARRDPEGVNLPRSRPTPDQIYTQMLVDVFTQLGPRPLEALPEMLWLDCGRAQHWGAVARRVVTAAAVLLQAKNLLKRDVRLPWKTEAKRVMAVLEKADADADTACAAAAYAAAAEAAGSGGEGAAATAAGAGARVAALSADVVVDGVMAALESGRAMPAATQATLRGFVQRTVVASAQTTAAHAAGAAAVTEPVLRLLLHRLRTYLAVRLAAAGSASVSVAEKVRQTNATGERLTSLGLAEFVDWVRELVDEVGRIGAVDREAHGAFWQQIASAVEAREAGAVA